MIDDTCYRHANLSCVAIGGKTVEETISDIKGYVRDMVTSEESLITNKTGKSKEHLYKLAQYEAVVYHRERTRTGILSALPDLCEKNPVQV